MDQFNEINKDHLKEMAVKVAAKNSDNLTKAVLEFVRLAYIESVPPLINDPSDAENMMRELLPPYRFPATDLASEMVSYYGWFDTSVSGRLFTTPAFFPELKNLNIPERLIQEIYEFISEAEETKNQLNKCCQKKSELESRIRKAERVWNGNEATNRKKTLVVQALGLSIGKVEKRQEPGKIFADYVDQVRKKGKSRCEAIKIVWERHSLPSFERTVRILQEHRKSIYHRAGNISPEFEKGIRKNLRGLVFDNRQVEEIISPY